MYRNISYSLPAADVAAVLAALDTVKEKLPFLVALTPAERVAITKRGPKSAEFLNDARRVAESFPELLPPTFNKEEFLKDIALLQAMDQVTVLIASLCEKVEHTHMAVGSELMVGSLEVYHYARTAKNRTPGMEVVVNRMKQRWKKTPAKKDNGNHPQA